MDILFACSYDYLSLESAFWSISLKQRKITRDFERCIEDTLLVRVTEGFSSAARFQ